MMFCPMNPNNQTNHINDGLYRLNGWSQVVPICMPWATPTAGPTAPQISLNTQYNAEPVMQFTANPVADPCLVSSLSGQPITASSVTEGLAISPDPCTSQTATRWELLHNLSTGRQSAHQHLKRRSDSSDEDLDDDLRTTPVKQHISEDKVSAIFNKLHITNNTVTIEEIEPDEWDDQSSDSSDGQQPSIVFTDELQSAIATKTVTDKLVQNELDKHSKALVLWQPPNPILPIGLNPTPEDKSAEESEPNCDPNQTNDNDFSDFDIEFIGDDEEEPIDWDNEMEL